ncbi:MAG: transporter [Candidatus Omnitrophica bacterium]|nr:transporter [Candidatus Omnitrophota bacterium]
MFKLNLKYRVCFLLFFAFLFSGIIRPVFSSETNAYFSSDSYSCSSVITWKSSKPTVSHIEYGLDAGYGSSIEEKKSLDINHQITLNNLSFSTTYHYRIVSKDVFDKEAVSADFTFTTPKAPASDQPIEISNVEASVIVAGSFSGNQTAPGLSSSKQMEVAMQPLTPPPDKITGEPQTEEEAKKKEQLVKEEPAIQETLIRKGGLLLPRGTLQIEPGVTYAHVSANKIALNGLAIIPVLVIGEISSQKIKKDIVIQSETFRYGLLDDLQWDLRVPYKYQHDRISDGTSTETIRSLSGWGDIETGLHYQFLREHGPFPDLIAGVTTKANNAKSPYGRDIGLGTGTWANKFSLVWVKSADPAIIFGSLAYIWNIEDDIDNFGKVDPGDTYQYSLGTAFALNYQLSLNFQIEQAVTTRLRLNDSSVPGSFTNVVNFKSGINWAISKNFSAQATATCGLTEDAPDFVLELSFPYTF